MANKIATHLDAKQIGGGTILSYDADRMCTNSIAVAAGCLAIPNYANNLLVPENKLIKAVTDISLTGGFNMTVNMRKIYSIEMYYYWVLGVGESGSLHNETIISENPSGFSSKLVGPLNVVNNYTVPPGESINLLCSNFVEVYNENHIIEMYLSTRGLRLGGVSVINPYVVASDHCEISNNTVRTYWSYQDAVNPFIELDVGLDSGTTLRLEWDFLRTN